MFPFHGFYHVRNTVETLRYKPPNLLHLDVDKESDGRQVTEERVFTLDKCLGSLLRYNLFTSFRIMSFAKIVKKTTGLTGLKVSQTPQHTLGVLYGKIMRTLNNLPQESAYRKYTEEIIIERASIVFKAKSTEEIEEKINCGQVEEIIVQAERELMLSKNFAKWKPWEAPTVSPPPNQWTWPPSNQ